MRRRSRRQKPFNYSQIGITTDPSAYRPSRGRVSADTAEVGRGPARWRHAWQQTLSWGIQRHTGYAILPEKLGPSANRRDDSADAAPPMIPRTTVRLRRRFGPLVMTMPVRIVDVIDEPRRKGFSFGTLAGHPVSGEVAFIVEYRSGDSVHFTLRSFSGPGRGLWALAYPVVLLLRGGLRESYLEALAGPLD